MAPSTRARWIVFLALAVWLVVFSAGPAKAELAAELTASPDPVVVGGQVQYVLTAVNRYTAASSRLVSLSVQVPAHMSVPVNAISGGGSCGTGVAVCAAGQTISWSGSYIDSGQARVVQFTAQVDAVDAPVAGTVLRASAAARTSSAEVAAGVDVLVSGTGLSLGLVAEASGVTVAPEACLVDRIETILARVIQHSALDRRISRLPGQSGNYPSLDNGPFSGSPRALVNLQMGDYSKGREITLVRQSSYPAATFTLNHDSDGDLRFKG